MKSADAGCPLAQVFLASFYRHGLAVKKDKKDLEEARKWWQKAANQGHYPSAKRNISE